jgi:hypothetical protein
MQKTQQSKQQQLTITPGRIKAQLRLVKNVAKLLGLGILEGYGEILKNDPMDIYKHF